MRHWTLPFILCICISPLLLAGEDGDAPAQPQESAVRLLDNSTRSGTVQQIINGSLVLEDSEDEIPLAQIWHIRNASRPSAAAYPENWLILADESIIACTIKSWNAETVTVSTLFSNTLDIPVHHVRGYLHATQHHPTPKTLETIKSYDDAKDQLVAVSKGKEALIQGLAEGYTDGSLQFHWNGKSRKVSVEKVRMLILAKGANANTEHTNATISLVDGSQLRGNIDTLKEDTLHITSNIGAISIPWDMVAEISFHTDNFIFIDSLSPISVTESTLLTPPTSFRRNESVYGGALQIGSQIFERGIGVHAQSSITYEIDNTYSEFIATIGIDTSTGGEGDCEFRVLLDNTEVFMKRVQWGDEPAVVRIPLNQSKRLTLRVDFGARLDIGDNANWAEARLIR